MDLKNKKLLILGANSETVELVNSAKKQGVYTVVTDNVPGALAKRVADKSYDIDGTDLDELEKMARIEKIDGVMVGTADPLVKPYYQLCKRLGLPSFGTDSSIQAFTNKSDLKKVCKKYGIQGIPQYTYEEVKEGKIQYPVLIKPADGRSGKGMTLCHSSEEIDDAIKKALDFSITKEYLIERYMQCDDVFLYYTFCDGNYYLSAMPDRFSSHEQDGVDPVVLGAVYPSKYLDLYYDVLHEKMCRMFSDMKIKNGVLLIQAFVENDEFYVYDPGFRLQGGAPHLLLDPINGIDQRKMLINLALTGKMGDPEIEQKNDPSFHGKCGASQTVLLKLGKIQKIFGIDEISRDPRVVATTQRLYEGDEVYLKGTEQQILVRFHMVCESVEDFKDLACKINETVYAIDTEGNNMCLKGLFE